MDVLIERNRVISFKQQSTLLFYSAISRYFVLKKFVSYYLKQFWQSENNRTQVNNKSYVLSPTNQAKFNCGVHHFEDTMNSKLVLANTLQDIKDTL